MGEHTRFEISFCSDVLGEFYEEFAFELQVKKLIEEKRVHWRMKTLTKNPILF